MLDSLVAQGGAVDVADLTGAFSYDNPTNTLTFDPTALFDAEKWYRVTIDSNVTDSTGNPLQADATNINGIDYIFEFKTEPPPTVISTTPSDTAQFQQVNTNITATFSDTMDAATVIDANFTFDELVVQGGAVATGDLPGAFSFDGPSSTLTFDPTALLDADTWYRATISSNVTDSTGNPIGYGVTDYTFEFKIEPPPSVVVTSPSDTAQFQLVNTNITATFSESMDVATVIAANFTLDELVAQGGAVATADLPGAFSYDNPSDTLTFDPTALLDANTWYRATISSNVTDSTGNPIGYGITDYVFEFSTEPPPTIVTTDPANLAQYQLVNTDITATFSESMDVATVIAANFILDELVAQGGAVATADLAGAFSYDDPSNTLTFDPTALLTASTWYRGTISSAVTDTTGNPLGFGITDYTFEFSTEPNPRVSATTPADSAQFVLVGSNVTVTFSEDMDEATVIAANFSLEELVSQGGAVVGPVAGSFSYDDGNNIITFDPTALLDAATWYRATVTDSVTNQTGNPIAADEVFEFKTEPNPIIAATSPNDTAQFVEVDTDVTVTFSEDMDETTVIAANFDLEELDGQGGGVVSTITGSFSYDDVVNNEITFDPTGVLIASTWYRTTVDSSVTDQTGNPLASDYVFEFMTEPNPTVVTTIPADNAQFIQVNASVTVTFSEDMNLASTVPDDESVITFYDGGTRINATAGGITYSSATQKLTFVPASLMIASTSYTVTILSSVTDLTGNPLAANYSFDFTVEPNSTIAATVPADGAQFIAVNTPISVTFSEDMDETSVTDANFELYELDTSVQTDPDLAPTTGPELSGTFNAYDDVNHVLSFDPTAGGTQVLKAATWYRAIISSSVTDQTGNPIGSSDYKYEFKTEPEPTIAGTDPFDSSFNVTVDTIIEVTFAENMAISPVVADDESVISVYDGATPISAEAGGITYDSGTQTLSFTPDGGLVADTIYIVTVKAVVADLTGNPLGSDFQFSFTTETNPGITSTDPLDDASDIPINSAIEIVFAEPMNLPATIDDDESVITIYDNDSPPNRVTASDISYDSGSQTLTFTPEILLAPATEFTVTILSTVEDATSNPIGTDFVFSFTSDWNPTVASTSPENNGTDVLVNSKIRFTFSKLMDETEAVNPANFSLVTSGGTPVSGSLSYKSATQTLKFAPDTSLLPSTTYTAVVTTGIQDLTGNTLASDVSISFTTESAPSVSAITPEEGTNGVALSAIVSATFSKEMDKSTIDESSFTLTDSDGNIVEGIVTFKQKNATVKFTPDAKLGYETTYTATLTSSITDDRGNNLPTFTWEFSTLGSTNFAEPVVVNNQIQAESTEPMRIFIPEPPAGPDDRVTVKIFTANGRRVMTLKNNRPYQEILAELPLVWDGTNGRRQRLGPGLYFIQITATDFKKVLKVMILR